MAVHFDFIMEDVDAENMLQALHYRACDYNEQIMDQMCDTTISDEYKASLIEALKSARDYHFNLIKLMKNTRVPE